MTSSPADLGTCTVRVEATDSDGDRTANDSAGRFVYYIAPVFEDVHTDRAEVDIDHRQVRVDGVLKGRWPGTRGSQEAIARLAQRALVSRTPRCG